MFFKARNQTLGIDWKNFYRGVIVLALPMALQNIINVGVTATDVLILGTVNEQALSGASLAGQLQYILTVAIYGVTSGASVMAAQYWGKKDTEKISKIFAIALIAGVSVASVFMYLAACKPYLVMQFYSSDSVVVAEGVKYLKIVAFSYVLMAVTQTYLNIIRSMERVIISTVIYSISLSVNVIVDCVLIWGIGGLPKLGITGAAIGTLSARIVEFGIVIWYARFRNKDLKISLTNFIHLDRILVRDFIVYAIPVVCSESLWSIGTSVKMAVVGHLGSAATAANAVAQIGLQIATIIAFGIANATAVYIGKTIGEQKQEHAKTYADEFAKIAVCVAVLGGILMMLVLVVAEPFFVLSVDAKYYLKYMRIIMAGFASCQAFNAITVTGIFRAGGDTKYGLMIDVLPVYILSIAGGLIAMHLLNAGVITVYLVLMADEFVKIPFIIKRLNSRKWLNDVTI